MKDGSRQMIKKIVITTAAIAAFSAAACSDTASNVNTTANDTNAPANVNASADTANVVANANRDVPVKMPEMSPTESFIALSEASRKLDVEGIKRRFSKATLVLFDEVAAEQGKTVDQILREPNGAPFPKLPDIGDEKIEGNTANLEIGDPETGSITVMPFVIEDGEWKIAMDVYLQKREELMQKQEDEAGNPGKQ